MTISKLRFTVFYSVLFLMPLNLGYHFIYKWAYIHGLLTDYLIPVIYLQDILISFLVLLSLPDILKKVFKRENTFFIWFLFLIILSSISSVLPQASFYASLRIFLYFFFMLFVKTYIRFEYDFPIISKTIALSIIFLSVLGIFQWVYQHSVFNNYLFFGEQPYNYFTPGVNKERFFNSTKIGSYGTFRHPNVFGGYLSIFLVWVFSNIRKNKLFFLTFILGIFALTFTLSKTAWISFLFGICTYLLVKRGKFRLSVLLVFLIALVGLFLPTFTSLFKISSISLVDRASLLVASYNMLLAKPIFGYGYNASTSVIQDYLHVGNNFKFAQPVHNIFILIASELGFIGLGVFLLAVFKKLKAAKESFLLVYISLLQLLILGSFDHYVFTMHQMQIVFWFLIGLV